MTYALVHIRPPASKDQQQNGAWLALQEMIAQSVATQKGVETLGTNAWLIPSEGSLKALVTMFQGSLAQHLHIRALLLEDPKWISLSPSN